MDGIGTPDVKKRIDALVKSKKRMSEIKKEQQRAVPKFRHAAYDETQAKKYTK